MNFKLLRSLAFVMAALIGTGVLTRPLKRKVNRDAPGQFASSAQLSVLAGQGSSLAVLGGLRSVVAGGFWLRTNLAWERRDLSETTALLELTVAADERSLYFWLNGARMLAYDMPEWQRVGTGPEPEAVRRRLRTQQARAALAFLEKGLRWHGASADIYVEMANLHLRRLGDPATAADFYRLAAEQPAAPYYAGRIYAELLVGLGREAEALAWLRALVTTLPPDDPAARSDVVRDRISALERRLDGDLKPF